MTCLHDVALPNVGQKVVYIIHVHKDNICMSYHTDETYSYCKYTIILSLNFCQTSVHDEIIISQLSLLWYLHSSVCFKPSFGYVSTPIFKHGWVRTTLVTVLDLYYVWHEIDLERLTQYSRFW